MRLMFCWRASSRKNVRRATTDLGTNAVATGVPTAANMPLFPAAEAAALTDLHVNEAPIPSPGQHPLGGGKAPASPHIRFSLKDIFNGVRQSLNRIFRKEDPVVGEGPSGLVTDVTHDERGM